MKLSLYADVRRTIDELQEQYMEHVKSFYRWSNWRLECNDELGNFLEPISLAIGLQPRPPELYLL